MTHCVCRMFFRYIILLALYILSLTAQSSLHNREKRLCVLPYFQSFHGVIIVSFTPPYNFLIIRGIGLFHFPASLHCVLD